MFTSILAAIDYSDSASRALDLAISLAKGDGAKLTVCNIIDPVQAVPSDPYGVAQPWLEELTKDGIELLSEATQRAAEVGVTVRTELLEGNPISTIIGLSQRNGCDLIVMGSHGRSGLQRLIVGSVAEAVMRAAKVPVLIAHVAATATRQVQPKHFAAA